MARSKIDYGRISNLLAPFRFAHHTFKSEEPSFVRTSAISDLFEAIVISTSGTRNEAVCAYVITSITRVPMYKTLGRARVIAEIASVPERGWTVVNNRDEAFIWEQSLASIADRVAKDWSLSVGTSLLVETEGLRQVAALCLDAPGNNRHDGPSIDRLSALPGVSGYTALPEFLQSINCIAHCKIAAELSTQELTALVHLIADRYRA